jgi:hypothetical protein
VICFIEGLLGGVERFRRLLLLTPFRAATSQAQAADAREDRAAVGDEPERRPRYPDRFLVAVEQATGVSGNLRGPNEGEAVRSPRDLFKEWKELFKYSLRTGGGRWWTSTRTRGNAPSKGDSRRPTRTNQRRVDARWTPKVVLVASADNENR